MKPILFSLILALSVSSAFAETGVVFESSFEAPVATAVRSPKANGGNISSHEGKPDWAQFEDQPAATPQPATMPASDGTGALTGTAAVTGTAPSRGGIVAGLTTDMARSGEQCLYIEAKSLSVPYAGVAFASVPIRIVPGKEYIVGIWGRNDAKTPLVSAAPQLFLKLQVDFFSDAGTTQTGDSEYLLQALPGSPGYPPTFVPDNWRQLRKRVVAPADANYMTITYRCDSSPDKGSLGGTMYFDDVTVSGEVPATDAKEAAVTPTPTPTPGPAPEATPAVQQNATPTPAPEATPTPTATPKAKKKRKSHVSE